MAQGINKIHPHNVIKSTFDGVMYQHNGFYWVKCEPTKTYISESEWTYTRPITLHKAYDINSTSDYIESDIIDGDYLAIYKTNYNDIIGSELLNDETKWVKSEGKLNDTDSNKKSTVALMQNRSIKMPENKDFCYSITNVKSPKILEHYISQEFISKASKSYCFSMFAKPIPSKDPSKIGLSLYSLTYNIGICCKYDINDITGYTFDTRYIKDWQRGVKYFPSSDIFFINEAGQTVTNTIFENFSAGMELYAHNLEDGNVDYYYRPFIIAGIKCNSPFKAKVMQLNPNGDWKFSENEIQYGNYFCGGQLEIKDYSQALTRPTRYITTTSERYFKRTLQNIYTYNTNRWVDNSDKNIYYLNDVTEKHMQTVNDQNNTIDFTTIEKSTPDVSRANDGDIALVNSIIVFSKEKDYVGEENISGVKLGNNFKEDDPLYSLYFDIYDDVYKIKVPASSHLTFNSKAELNAYSTTNLAEGTIAKVVIDETHENELSFYEWKKVNNVLQWVYVGVLTEYVELKSTSENEVKDIIAKAMIYNQGYFETYCERSNYRPRFGFGFNTGGNYNFWKTKYLKHNHH